MLDFRSYCLFEDTLQHTPGLTWGVLADDLNWIIKWYEGAWMHQPSIAPQDKTSIQIAFRRVCATVGWVPKEETLYRDVGWHALAGGTIPVKGWSGTVSVSNKDVQSWTDKKSLAKEFNREIHSWQSDSKYSVVVSSNIDAAHQLVNQNSMLKFIDAADNFIVQTMGVSLPEYNANREKALSPEVLDKFKRTMPFSTSAASSVDAQDVMMRVIGKLHYIHQGFVGDAWGRQHEIVVVGPKERQCKILEVFVS